MSLRAQAAINMLYDRTPDRTNYNPVTRQALFAYYEWDDTRGKYEYYIIEIDLSKTPPLPYTIYKASEAEELDFLFDTLIKLRKYQVR